MSKTRGGLPELLARVASAAGPEAARRLVERFGGTTIWIPLPGEKDSVLCRAVGAEATAKIIKCIGSGHVEVPTGRSVFMRERITAMLGDGATVAEIARTLGIHQRTVYRWRRLLRRSKPRHRVFDLASK